MWVQGFSSISIRSLYTSTYSWKFKSYFTGNQNAHFVVYQSQEVFFFRSIFQIPRLMNNIATVITDTLQSWTNNIYKQWLKISLELISSWTGWDNLSGDWGDCSRLKMGYIILHFITVFSMPCLSRLLLGGPNSQPLSMFATLWAASCTGGSSSTSKHHWAPSAAIDFSGDWVNWMPGCIAHWLAGLSLTADWIRGDKPV